MMIHLRFELKKLRKNGMLTMVIVAAIFLGLANQVYSRSKLSSDYKYISSLEQYCASAERVVSTPFNPVGTTPLSYGDKVLSAYEQKIILQDSSHYYKLMPSREMFARAIIIAEDEDLEWTKDEEDELRFAFFQTDFLENRQIEEESLENPSALYLLKRGFPFIYGISPLLLFLAIAHRFQSEDKENGSLVFNASLPKAGSREIVARFVALALLAILYIFFVSAFSILFSLLSGVEFGSLDYPNRVIGLSAVHLTNLDILLRVFLDSFLGILTVISLGLFLSVKISSSLSVAALSSLSLLFLKFVIDQTGFLQNPFNPLYFAYQSKNLGTRVLNISEQSLLVRGFVSRAPYPFHILLLPSFILLILFLIPTVFASRVKTQGFKGDQYYQSKCSIRFSQSPIYKVYFEWRKLDEVLGFRQGILVFVFLGIFFSSILIYRDVCSLEDRYWHRNLTSFDESNEEIENEIAEVSKRLEEDELKRQEKDELSLYIKGLEIRKKDLKLEKQEFENRITAYEEGDSENYYAYDIDSIKAKFGKRADYFDEAASTSYVHGDTPSNFGYEVNLQRNKLLRERNISPLLQSEYLPTVYDEMKDPLRQREETLRSQIADHSVLGISHRLFHYYRLDIVFIIILVFTCGAGYAIEQQKSASICWIYTLPQSRSQVALQKYLSSLIRALQYLLAFFLPLVIIGMGVAGFGRGDFPVLRYLDVAKEAQYGENFSNNYEFRNLAVVVAEILALLLVACFFLMALSLLISCFLKNVMSSTSIVLLLLAGGYFAQITWLKEADSSWLSFLPFAYLDVERIVSGELVVNTGYRQLSARKGIIVFLLWSVILMVLINLRIRFKRTVVNKD